MNSGVTVVKQSGEKAYTILLSQLGSVGGLFTSISAAVAIVLKYINGADFSTFITKNLFLAQKFQLQ